MGKSRAPRSQTHTAPPGRDRVRALLLRGLGVVYLIAFGSLWVQAPGLTGPEGIVPLEDTFAAARALAAEQGATGVASLDAALILPTLGWLVPLSTRALCLLGMVAAGMLLATRRSGPALLAAAALYLSCQSTAAPFLNFQWDILLIEASVAASLIAPWRTASTTVEPPAWAWWPLRWLLFRVVFLSGVVKLQSGDTTWRDLTALAFHYESQPIPNPLAWYAHQLPGVVQQVSTLATFGVELVLALGLLGPRRLRGPAAASVLALMAVLALTGNYGFFQLLTAVLCLSVLDDEHLRRPPQALPAAPPRSTRWITGAAAAALIVLSTTQVLERHSPARFPEPIPSISRVAAPFRISNNYGLFANMTTNRPTVVLEARWDDSDWIPVRWRYQPTQTHTPPPQVAPHMPRLDWMLWFAGYQGCTPWVQRLQQRLLEGSPPVRALIGDLRLAGRAPTEVRTVRRHLRFTQLGSEEARAGAWWRIEGTTEHCPPRRLSP